MIFSIFLLLIANIFKRKLTVILSFRPGQTGVKEAVLPTVILNFRPDLTGVKEAV